MLLDQFDKSLLSTANMLTAVIDNEERIDVNDTEEHHDESTDVRSVEFEFDVRMTPEFSRLNGGGYYQLWDAEGMTLDRSPSLGDASLDHSGSGISPQYRDSSLPDNVPVRAVLVVFAASKDVHNQTDEGQGSPALSLAVARDSSKLWQHLRYLRILLLAASAGLMGLSVAAGFTVTRFGLSPLRSLAGEISTIDSDNLAGHFTGDYPVELMPICRCLDTVMKRLETSFQRERRFNADVAHELRTPLAGVQSTVEVALSQQRQELEYREALCDCLTITKTMSRLIDTLLALSRLESGKITFDYQPVKIREFVEDVWRVFADRAYDKGAVFENQLSQQTTFSSDKDYLRAVLSNILENALEYNEQNGRIIVAAEDLPDEIVISVSNTSRTIGQEDLEHIFEPFWRKDTSRTDSGRHCGVGLAVVRKVAETMGAAVKVRIDQGVFTIALHFPRDRKL
jgi:two-component system sensor histidine kinase QseC